MRKLDLSDEWYKEASKAEEGYDISAGPGDEYVMEKLGIAKKDLVNELKDEYVKLRREESLSSIKTASSDKERSKKMADVKAKLDELEKEDGGTAS